MANRTASQRRGSAFTIFRFGLAISQAVMGLFAGGSVLLEAHHLFLWYYAREWGGIQFAGVNDCMGEDRVANGDLFEGQTFCNHPINFVPWIEVYRRHWREAGIYYGVILLALIIIGALFFALQRRLASTTPFGANAVDTHPSESEHLR